MKNSQPTPPPSNRLEPAELSRYNRHIILPEVGVEGQQKLKGAKVLLIGAGGLGSPVALYLAAAGIGTIGILDFDTVDESNLQRQIIHRSQDVGRAKVESASNRLREVNPHIEIETYRVRLTAANALEILRDYDIVVDGSDNFATRYLINDACVLLGKPNVFGSIFRFQGQVSVFHPAAGGPCYRCLHCEPPPAGMVPSCAEGGVLGVLPGVVGTLQATETIKFILQTGESLVGRLLMFDALTMKFREMSLQPDPNCALCGSSPTITQLVDTQEPCSIKGERQKAEEVTPLEFHSQWQQGRRPLLLDVREPHEWDIANLADHDARLVPLATLLDHSSKLDKAADIVIHCKSGRRSAKAQAQLLELGFSRVRNLAGGILRWSDEVDPSKQKY